MISASQSRNHVTFHMIHRDYGLIPHERERFCEIYANPECGLKTGAVSYCYCIYVRHFTFRNEVEKRLAKSWPPPPPPRAELRARPPLPMRKGGEKPSP